MIGKINENGWLEIERAGNMKIQYYPYTDSDNDNSEARYCGSWCPLFSEPEKFSKIYKLELCQNKTILFDKFKDERE